MHEASPEHPTSDWCLLSPEGVLRATCTVLRFDARPAPTPISEDVGFEHATTWYEWMINASEQSSVMELVRVTVPELPEAAGSAATVQ